ncbi:nucleoside hydrolase [Arcanobacterium buesumense]|uniref:Nucleoside hydrolase n=1 Tax=Arcanobacterium buesumense TaxID=2722751 RepID=A0A6H2EMV6_9ACTO|nr:nucleoside hydrolase [Arcanobacterium buesumense]QJC22404.1 nucleoside hydrolase [Arcanobacterium buesumense]
MVEKIILDCDPGHDDAIAMLLAAGNPNIELLGITTVAGNQTLEKVTRNALSVCAAANITVPVARGAAGPLVQRQITAPEIHGTSGLDGPVLPEAHMELDPRHGVDFIIETIMSQPAQTVHLVPVGPLTNIALAARKEPAIIDRVKSVILMGGAYTRGNSSPAAEFNIFADPEAAHIVFEQSWPVTMVSLDLTHQALATQELQDRVRDINTDLSRFVLDIWGFVGAAYKDMYDFPAPPIHDAVCVAALIDPQIITCSKAFVTVELTGTWTRGMTVTSFKDVAPMRHPFPVLDDDQYRTDVATTLDWDRFAQLVVDSIRALGR